MIYDTKALYKKDLEANLEEFKKEGWEINPKCLPLSQYKDTSVVYLRKEYVNAEA